MNAPLSSKLGWVPDLPDPRDFTLDHSDIREALSRLPASDADGLPGGVDLRDEDGAAFLTGPPDQLTLQSSAAFAILGLLEYFERRTRGNSFEPSALFVYHMARKLRGFSGDTGVDLRTAFKAVSRFGVPPDSFWPYLPERFEKAPCDMSLLGFARDYANLRFFRATHAQLPNVDDLRSLLAAGFPIAFGWSVPFSLGDEAIVPFRPTFDAVRGGQASLLVGYDDDRLGAHQGAFLFRNSWGRSWGDGGYGWLPYSFVRHGLARDFWSALRDDWLSSGELRRPARPSAQASPSRSA